MKYLQLFTLHNLALLNDWFEESGSLFVDVYIPHSASDSDKYFVNSIEELKELVKRQNSGELEISIYRDKRFLISGEASQELLSEATTKIKDGEDFVIVSVKSKFPDKVEILENGDSHIELEKYLSKYFGENIGIEIDSGDSPWHSRNSAKMFQLLVRKNQNWYEKAAQNIEKYKYLEKFWSE